MGLLSKFRVSEQAKILVEALDSTEGELPYELRRLAENWIENTDSFADVYALRRAVAAAARRVMNVEILNGMVNKFQPKEDENEAFYAPHQAALRGVSGYTYTPFYPSQQVQDDQDSVQNEGAVQPAVAEVGDK